MIPRGERTLFTSVVAALAAVALFCGERMASAQVSQGGTPPSFALLKSEPVPTLEVPPLDTRPFLAEDEGAMPGTPARFGVEIPVEVHPYRCGVWSTLPDGDRLWRVRLCSPKAYSINLLFHGFWLPPGAELFVYNDDRSMVLGAFTARNNKRDGLFAIHPVKGDAITLEYREPAAGAHGVLFVSRLVHAYRDLFATEKEGEKSGSGSCNINVNCPLGDNYQDVKRSVARIVMGGGMCSGVLINNTALDEQQFFLTAYHCYAGSVSPSFWVFLFNYEASDCSGTTGPTTNTVQGATHKASAPSADACLVRINEKIPSSYQVFYSGWDWSGSEPTSTVGIHHPQGDIKKICYDADPPTAEAFGGVNCWHIGMWDQGVTEPGSSGSPLLDPNKRIVGQLYGGYSSCTFLYDDYYGRLAESWGQGLSAHLDPLGTGATVLDGVEGGQVLPDLVGISISGPTKVKMKDTAKLMVDIGLLSYFYSYTFEIRLSKDEEITSDDKLVISLASSVDGPRWINVTVPKMKKGKYYWGLIVSPVSGETATENNTIVGNKVKVKK